MKEKLISLETAILAKEVGCNLTRCECGGFPECICEENDKLRITQSLLQKWLREIYSIDVYVAPRINSVTGIREYWATLFTIDCSMTISTDTHKSFEEVLEEGLYRALLQIPDKKNK